jgi:hypothetical protein
MNLASQVPFGARWHKSRMGGGTGGIEPRRGFFVSLSDDVFTSIAFRPLPAGKDAFREQKLKCGYRLQYSCEQNHLTRLE